MAPFELWLVGDTNKRKAIIVNTLKDTFNKLEAWLASLEERTDFQHFNCLGKAIDISLRIITYMRSCRITSFKV